MDQGSPLPGIILFFGAIAFVWWGLRALRRKRLMEKYGDEEIVNRLMRREILEGQSAEKLIDSRGNPAQKDTAVFKTKTKDTWKYDRIGRGQYRLRVFVENDRVVGWKANAR